MQNQEQTTQDTTLPQQGRLEIWRQGFKRAFLQFLVLMWMHLTLRKRKFIVTPIELISPCFFFIIILAIKPLIYENLGVEEPPGTTVLRMHEVPLDNIMAPQLILYTPDTPLTRRLMDEAGRKMYMTRILDFPVASSRGYYGLNEDSIKYNIRLSNLLRSMSDFSAVVIFEDMEDEYWPERLNYLIRIKNDFDGKEAGEDKTSQHSRGMSELFMRLQWAIDTSYMTLFVYDKSNRNIAADVPKLSLSEIPLSDALTEVIVHIVCTALRITCPIALMLPFVFLLSKLIDERSTGAQELLKQVGVSFSTWANAHGCNMILTGLFYSIFGTVACKVPDPYIPKSNAILLFLLFELHFHSILTFAFICCYMTKSGDYATTLSVALFIVSTVPARMLDGRELPQIVLYLTGLLPHVPFIWFWREVESLETNGTGVNFISFTKSHTTTSMSVLMGYAMMVLQILIFFRIAIYFDAICPGKYGTKKPWNYMWKRKENVALTAMAEVAAEDTTRDPRFFEESRQLTNIGINIDQVSKIFGKKIALSNVSLHVYHGEITVLLGHNGAGKTTLMSIITGMLSPTSGNVYVKGLDICQDQAKVQTMVGVCPQHNLFFPDLTVMEHVRLFAMLKGQSYEKANESSKILLQKLNIESKKNNKASELSGGMKRRLQLACALSGDSSVLVLDEPTSGLDVETRRELWDLLLSLRGDRTVVLSTHFMEEADALGDRVAALHAGRLQCHATPMFLKKNIGSGYRLFLTTEGRPQEHDITKLVTSVVSAATVKESGYNSISYNLPSESSKKFPQLFSKLESKKAQLSIISIGVGVSSLEDVFLQLCSNVETTFTEEAVDIGIPETQYLHHKGLILYVRQMCVLMRRQMRFLMYQKYSFIILQVLVPFAIMFLMGFLLRGGQANPQYQNKTTLNLEMNDEKPIKTILLRVNSPEFRTNRKLDWLNTGAYKNVVFQVTNDVANTEFRASQKDTSSGIDSSELKEYFMGVELNNTNAKVKYTTKVRHAAPVAINLLSNILATQYFPKADGRTITTNHQPLDDENRPLSLPTLEMPKDITQCVMWICIHVIIIKSTLINSVALPATEREAGTRHIHLMSGCAPAVHWLTTVLTHTLLYAVVLMLPITLIFHIDNIEKTFNNNAFIGVMLLILLLGSISFLFLCYLVTFVFSKRGSGLLLTHIIILFGTIPAVVLFMPNITGNDADKRMKIPSLIIYYTVSPCTMTLAALKAASVARLKAMCHLNLELCPVLLVHIFELSEFFSPENKGFDPKMCCLHRKSTLCTVCMNENGVGKELIILFVQIIIYGAFVILAEYGIFNGIHDRICNIRYKPKPSRFHDTNVVVEKLYVSERMKEPRSQLIEGSDGMLVNNIHKNYFNICKKSVNAVRGISFSVKKGKTNMCCICALTDSLKKKLTGNGAQHSECFGLLGVNGAGKSTTFKMISAEEVTTRGNIYTNGEILKWPRSSKYIRSLGYCPQFFGLDEFMTGRENLATLLTMHGLNTKDIITETEAWINAVGLERYRDVLVLDYSGGCMRRLATAAALSSGAPITLLDEPTAGVDVSARRRMWVALRKGLRQNRAIIITSHSMDEMEALCNRIVIMSAGEIATLGSAPALRAAYASGHALSIKINSAGTNLEKLPELKNSLDKKFNCTLTDEHATMLSYHINETMHYSVIFKELEKLKNEYPEVMEDYSVTETTLEEVFLSFAKPVQEEQQPNKKQKKK